LLLSGGGGGDVVVFFAVDCLIVKHALNREQSIKQHAIVGCIEEGRAKCSGSKKNKNYSTSYSRVISHHSTDDAITSLTSEIERDPVLSSMYGRS
jgi:hypothetical protein